MNVFVVGNSEGLCNSISGVRVATHAADEAVAIERVSHDKNVEQPAEQETWQLVRPATPLETCKILSDKIEREIAAMKDELARIKA